MTPFAINLVLAFVWAALNGGIGLSSLLVGFLVGYSVLFVLQPCSVSPATVASCLMGYS